MKRYSLIFALILLFQSSMAQKERPVLNIILTNYTYPYEVHFTNFKSQNQDLKMVYMDVHPQKPNGRTVVLLHGKNFNSAYCKTTIEALTKEGYRVIAPDQVGFGKSSKITKK